MEWITEYWFVIILGLAAAIFFFGFRADDRRENETDKDSNETRGDKGGHSCCH